MVEKLILLSWLHLARTNEWPMLLNYAREGVQCMPHHVQRRTPFNHATYNTCLKYIWKYASSQFQITTSPGKLQRDKVNAELASELFPSHIHTHLSPFLLQNIPTELDTFHAVPSSSLSSSHHLKLLQKTRQQILRSLTHCPHVCLTHSTHLPDQPSCSLPRHES